VADPPRSKRHYASKHEMLGASPKCLSLYARWPFLGANFGECPKGEVASRIGRCSPASISLCFLCKDQEGALMRT
jgi:hypothetical protein